MKKIIHFEEQCQSVDKETSTDGKIDKKVVFNCR